MKKRMTIALMLVCGVATAFVWLSGVSGTWTGSLPMGGGNTYPLKYIFKTDGSILKGSSEAEQGSVDLTEGKLYGDSLSFVINAMGMRMRHTGRYFLKGDSIGLDIYMNGQKYHATLNRTN